jgi:hypothetical protein
MSASRTTTCSSLHSMHVLAMSLQALPAQTAAAVSIT